MDALLIIVARDQPELLARLTALYAHEPAVEIRVDQRQGQRWTEPGDRPERRSRPFPEDDVHDHGFMLVFRS